MALIAALAPAPAQAGCPICDQYTLDIPDPTNGGSSDGGSFDAGSEPAPQPDPAPEPTSSAPATTTPSATVPATTAPVTTTDTSADESKPKHHAEPAPEPFVPVRADGAPDSAVALTSVPLDYDGEGSAPGAALAGLDSPGTIALLAALIAAGAAVAVGRRRSPAT